MLPLLLLLLLLLLLIIIIIICAYLCKVVCVYVVLLFNALFHCRCLVLSVYVLRFMTLGSKINSKFTNTSGLLTEQVSKGEIPLYNVNGKRISFPPGPKRGGVGEREVCLEAKSLCIQGEVSPPHHPAQSPPPPSPLGGGHLRVVVIEVCR